MPAEFVRYKPIRKPFREKKADFGMYERNPEYKQAFDWIRKALAKHAILHHIDYDAAANPEASGRPLELYIDASGYGWAGVLTQRLVPHGAPKIVSLICKGFKDVEVRWSAMERALFALWRGVVEHEKYLKESG